MATASMEEDSIIEKLFSVNLKPLLTPLFEMRPSLLERRPRRDRGGRGLSGASLDQLWLRYCHAGREITAPRKRGKSGNYITILRNQLYPRFGRETKTGRKKKKIS